MAEVLVVSLYLFKNLIFCYKFEFVIASTGGTGAFSNTTGGGLFGNANKPSLFGTATSQASTNLFGKF